MAFLVGAASVSVHLLIVSLYDVILPSLVVGHHHPFSDKKI
jgi:hypothetical protein